MTQPASIPTNTNPPQHVIVISLKSLCHIVFNIIFILEGSEGFSWDELLGIYFQMFSRITKDPN